MHTLGRRLFVSSALVMGLFTGMVGDAAAQPTSWAGQRLGRTHQGDEVKVLREVGSSAGYDDRLQATAVARMANAEPAVVVKGRDNKWHALVTSANAFGGLASAADNFEVREMVPLPSTKAIVRSGRVDAAFAAAVLGVEAKDVQLTASSTSREARFINVNGQLGDLGKHGPERAPSEEFKPGVRTAIELNLSLFQGGDVRAANAVLFHEASHRADYELAQRWATAYTRETGRPFMANGGGPLFVKWVLERDPRTLSRDDAQTVVDVAAGANGTTEARAYVGTFIAATQAGAHDAARDQLLTYARGLDKKINRPNGETVPAALRADLDKAFQSLDSDGKARFKACFAAAKAAAPNAWISKYEPGGAKRS